MRYQVMIGYRWILLAVLLGACAKPRDRCAALTSAAPVFVFTGGAVAADGTATTSDVLATTVAGVEPTPEEETAWPAFVASIDFTRSDVAIVRSGGERGVVRGVVQASPTDAVVVASTVCSPCGGGDPGSYESARASWEAARWPSTSIVAIAKGSRLTVEVCRTDCGTCARDVP